LPGAGSDATSIRGSGIFVLVIDPELGNIFVRIEQVLQKELSILSRRRSKVDWLSWINEEYVLLDLVQRSMNANAIIRTGKDSFQ
jgi:hypothetical protein